MNLSWLKIKEWLRYDLQTWCQVNSTCTLLLLLLFSFGLIGLGLSCILGCVSDPTLDVLSPTGNTGIRTEGGDSIALWLAIAGLVITPIAGAKLYEKVIRPMRLAKNHNGGAVNGTQKTNGSG